MARTDMAWSATRWLTKWLVVSVIVAMAAVFLHAAMSDQSSTEEPKESLIHSIVD